jgi:hypothetical protein
MGDFLAGPQFREDIEDLVGAPAPLAELYPGDRELPRVPADPDPQLVAPTRQHVQTGDLLGEQHRVADRRDQDAGPDPDPRRATGRERQGLERR